MPHIRLWRLHLTGKYDSPQLCGVFEAGIGAAIHHPHVPLTLHMGLLRCGLFEAMPDTVPYKCLIPLQSGASVH